MNQLSTPLTDLQPGDTVDWNNTTCDNWFRGTVLTVGLTSARIQLGPEHDNITPTVQRRHLRFA